MTAVAPILLVDDGELDDVREMLDGLGVEYAHLRGGDVPMELERPRSLFVCTARRARLAEPWHGSCEGLTRICIVTEDSHTARTALRRMGFDYLVRRPFHPYALRLLVLRSMYGGEERRRGSRAAVGAPVSYRAGLRLRKGTLADLSLGGCRLLTDHALAAGSRVTLLLPKAVVGGRGTWLRCKVARLDAPTASGQHVVGLRFERAAGAQKKILEALRHLDGRLAVLPETSASRIRRAPVTREPLPAPEAAPDPLPELPEAAPASFEDRRKAPRSAYEGEVVHLDDEAGRVLVGRNISAGGMRVEPHPDLEPGASLRLAIYGSSGDQPFIVRARVVSNDGAAGVGLQFENLLPAVAGRIEGLVAQLPTVEPLQAGEADALGSVVSRVLEEDEANSLEPTS